MEEVLARLARARHPDDEPVGIGVAMAGIVRRGDGLVTTAPNLGWVNGPLGDRLTAALATSRSSWPTTRTSAPSRNGVAAPPAWTTSSTCPARWVSAAA